MANKYRNYKFEDTYACGHTGKISRTGYSKEAAKVKANEEFEKECPECRRKRFLRENRERAEEIKRELGQEDNALPMLIGSEKQINWALTIRDDIISWVDQIDYEDRIRYNLRRLSKDRFLELFGLMLENEKSASVWIDIRDDFKIFPVKYVSEYEKFENIDEVEEILIEEVKKEIENVVIPENFNDKNVTVENKIDKIIVSSDKDYTIINLVKSKGYKWDKPYWVKNINNRTGDVQDRMADIINALLLKGYGVKIISSDFEKIKEKATSATFEIEQTNWIDSIDSKHIGIEWKGKNDSLYEAARKIKGSKWAGLVKVPISEYKAIEDFAELKGFSFTEKAKEVLDKYKETLEETRVEVTEKDIKPLIKVADEIDLSDLIDD